MLERVFLSPIVFYFSCKNAALATGLVYQWFTRGMMVASVARNRRSKKRCGQVGESAALNV
jgi:hypothetical protein